MLFQRFDKPEPAAPASSLKECSTAPSTSRPVHAE
jgi:hypothetical protein